MNDPTLVLLVVALLGTSVRGGQPQAQIEPQEVEVPLHLKNAVRAHTPTFNPVSGREVGLEVGVDPFQRELRLRWFKGPRESRSRPSRLQIVALGTTPTAIQRSASYGRFFLGSTDSRGVTRIEDIEFSEPPTTRGTVGNGTILRRDVLFQVGRDSGLSGTYQLFANHADPNRLFFELDAPRRLYSLDLTTKIATHVASVVPVGQELVVPSLMEPQWLLYSRDHQTHGHVYFFVPKEQPNATTVIRDLDRDGTLDDVVLIPDSAALHALGFAYGYSD